MTVASASSDVIDAVVEGLIGRTQPAVVQGDEGWDVPPTSSATPTGSASATSVGCTTARARCAPSAEPRHGTASSPTTRPTRGPGRSTPASTAARTSPPPRPRRGPTGSAPVAPESAPYAAFDGDRDTGWRSAYYQRARGQWVEARWPDGAGHRAGRDQLAGQRVPRSRPSPGGRSRPADRSGAAHGTTRSPVSRPRTSTGVSVPQPADHGRQGERQRAGPGLGVRGALRTATPIGRSMVLPRVDLAPTAAASSSAPSPRPAPASRPCWVPTAPDSRRTLSEESAGMDRTVEVPAAGTWDLERHRGGAVAARRRRPAQPAGQPGRAARLVAVALRPGGLGAAGLRRCHDHVVGRRPPRRAPGADRRLRPAADHLPDRGVPAGAAGRRTDHGRSAVARRGPPRAARRVRRGSSRCAPGI